MVRTPADAVLAAPLLLGYWPEGSVGAIVLDDDHRVVLVMRWDAETEGAIALPPRAVAGGASPHVVHLVAYSCFRSMDELPTAPATSAWRHAEESLRGCGASLGWILVASNYVEKVLWTFLEGSAAELEVRDIPASEISRQALRWGLPPWSATRSAYVGDVDPDPEAREHVIAHLSGQVPVVEASRDAAIAHVRDRLADQHITFGDIAAVLVCLTDVQVRDTVLWDLMQEDTSQWLAIAPHLARIVAAAPDTHVAPPATLLAILRWQMGDGSRAGAAVARALAADPAYTLARLVDGCLATGMHPSVWRAGLAGLSREECRRAA